ncbi:hypothetical protein CRYUN_Cryun31cG0129000 [Craigia yunnanensis]
MAAAAAPDHLFNLRNNFYLGLYQAAINNSDLPNLSPDDAVDRDCLVYRSYIALATYQESTILSLKEWLADPAIGNNAILRLIAGIVFMHEEDYNEALKHTNAGGTMELIVDNAFFSQPICLASLFVAGSKMQEAYLIFQDFSEKYPMTGLILNGKAVCSMHMGNFDEAETLLLEALNKDAKDPETLANLVVCSLHLGKSSSRYLSSTLPICLKSPSIKGYLETLGLYDFCLVLVM